MNLRNIQGVKVEIFSLISQKGGAGKSTLARQLAVLAGEAGVSILIDRDPQGTSTKGSSGNIRIEYHTIGLFLDFRCLRSLLPPFG